ncbi:hypothetical protein DKX38_020073 [Salix brachista]|uniref:Uncharacterized protein n=1 Tax=Salix brachista TaxID=2182728 RepID=A0A5N5KI02_9ROSI|nr:hypothetical protein DKX38_020073 [Salix brachista]
MTFEDSTLFKYRLSRELEGVYKEVFHDQTETKHLDQPYLGRKSLSRVLQELHEKSKQLDEKFADDEDVVRSPYESKRVSPGGPDPRHH